MKTRAFVALLAVALVMAYIFGKPAWEDCRAAGHDRATCSLTLKYWSYKHFWGF